jgi:hypothetical protein
MERGDVAGARPEVRRRVAADHKYVDGEDEPREIVNPELRDDDEVIEVEVLDDEDADDGGEWDWATERAERVREATEAAGGAVLASAPLDPGRGRGDNPGIDWRAWADQHGYKPHEEAE